VGGEGEGGEAVRVGVGGDGPFHVCDAVTGRSGGGVIGVRQTLGIAHGRGDGVGVGVGGGVSGGRGEGFGEGVGAQWLQGVVVLAGLPEARKEKPRLAFQSVWEALHTLRMRMMRMLPTIATTTTTSPIKRISSSSVF
jgi:hypothetical protein